MTEECVILVDEENRPIGTAPKAGVHHANTPLHRAFSCFVFNSRRELLLQQRAHHKVTWPGVWSNSCCGHPLPDEIDEDAVRRRLSDELGVTDVVLQLALPDYRYRAQMLGVVENEFCPVWIGFSDVAPKPNPDEVADVQSRPWTAFLSGVTANTDPFYQALSPWCRAETRLLTEGDVLPRFLREHGLTT
jgi:isopentenyl-diphosphate Delta-isomerase